MDEELKSVLESMTPSAKALYKEYVHRLNTMDPAPLEPNKENRLKWFICPILFILFALLVGSCLGPLSMKGL